MSTGNAILDGVLAAAERDGASDLHLATGHRPMLRIRGELQAGAGEVLSDEAVRGIRDCLLTVAEGQLDGESNDLDFACTLGEGVRYRVNAYRTMNGAALAIRRLESNPPPLEDLPAPPAVRALGGRESGLVLVTGPTGSGKSTTLAALIDRINATRAQHIITIEDPVEYVHPNRVSLVNQREVGRHTESFRTALRSALREDPDVILVGELRDLETISLALTAAETGQLVLASLHSPTAPQAIDRIIDVFPGNEKELTRSMLSTALAAVVTQRLLPRRGGGRVAAMEVMLGTSAVRNQIREGKIAQLHQTIELGTQQGMQTMTQSIQALEDQGLLDAEVADYWRGAFDPSGAATAEPERPRGDDARPPEPSRRGRGARAF